MEAINMAIKTGIETTPTAHKNMLISRRGNKS